MIVRTKQRVQGTLMDDGSGSWLHASAGKKERVSAGRLAPRGFVVTARLGRWVPRRANAPLRDYALGA